jgi:hypothetical protein
MDVSYIKKIVEEVFSKSGYKVDKFTLFCPSSLDVRINKIDDGISFDFTKVMPSVRTKKLFIPITAYVEGIFLGKLGGTIKLKYFPDFEFKYSGFEQNNFGSAHHVDLSDIKSCIAREYPDKQRRKIANLALQYANEWATIVSHNGVDFSRYDKKNKKLLAENCQKFVHENIVNSKEIEAKSAILTFILVYLILPSVISWVVKKFLDSFFK